MRTTITVTGEKARKKILEGVNAIYQVVKVTFGPEGKNALLYRSMNRGNRITNDGVTVAECQEPKDQFVRMAAQTFRETCKKTNEKVGDGTTQTTILAGELYNQLHKMTEKNAGMLGENKGSKVMSLRKEILESGERVKEKIKESAKKIKNLKDLEKVAIVSVEDEELGKTIAKVAWEVGVNGFIDVVEGYKGIIETEVIKGMRFPAKIAAKGFVNKPERFEMVVEDSAVILTNYKLDSVVQMSAFLNPILNKNPKIAIFAPDFSNEVLNELYKATYKIINDNGKPIVTKGQYDLIPVKVPSLRTEQFDDLAVYFGATFINKNNGDKLSSITENDLGFVEKLVVKDTEVKEDAVATGGGGTKNTVQLEDGKEGVDVVRSEVEKRIEVLQGQMEETKQLQFKKLLERRIASIASAVGVIRVGDSTEANSLYKKLKIEDAVYACKSALKGGYVKGGGLCLKEIADKLSDDNILKPILYAPYEQIQNSMGGNVEIGDDIIDPMEALYYAIEHATQVVANLITIDSITCEEEFHNTGDGEYAIAKALMEYVIADKIHKGQIKEGEREQYIDGLGGVAKNDYEFEILNQD